MKNINFKTYLATAVVALFVLTGAISFNSCKKESGDAMPVISSFRVTEKDSAITAGSFGLTIAIMGQDLQDVQEVWFNDLKAALNPNFVTSSNIICAIPNTLPGEITNKVKLVTKSGQEYLADFKVILPPPVILGLYNEMAAPGTVTKVLGNAFYFIKEVKFGNLPATIADATPTSITVTVPAGAIAGSLITVTGEGGTVVSKFKYKDQGLWLFDFDKNATSWGSLYCWGGMKYRSDSEAISGQYGFIEGAELPPSSWNNDWVASTCWFDFGLSNVDFTNKVLKFEINAKIPWVWSDAIGTADHAELLITINGGQTYHFMPQESLAFRTTGFSTIGWMTVTVPMSAFPLGVASINDFQLVFKTNKQVYSKFATFIDNFRICTPAP